MRKNWKMKGLIITAAVMMALTACGSKKAADASAETGTAQETTEETTEAVLDTTQEIEDTTAEEEEDTTEDAAEEETEVNEAGAVGTDGIFTSATGKYTVTPPSGWILDSSSSEKYATFFAENGDDMLELVCVTGGEAESMLEELPDTAEEYKERVNREDNMEILKYEVSREDDGSQTFEYAMRYTDPSDDIHFLASSGNYNAAKDEYIAATGTMMSSEDGVEDALLKAVESLKIK